MKSKVKYEDYNIRLEPSDWRYSAAIIGLIKYLEYHNLNYKVEDDCILYNSSDITEKKYLEFTEYEYGDEFPHKFIENILLSEYISDEQVQLVNEKFKSNEIMKKVFNKIKFDNTNKKIIIDRINENRTELIKETFRNKKNMYSNYANKKQLFNNSQDYCRLLGYYIDTGKKGKSTGFNFTMNSFIGKDEREFDFIPFAFEGNRESFFINDNYTIKRLKISNKIFSEKVKLDLDGENRIKDARRVLFKGIMEATDFISRDVEIIFKDRDKDYFETLYVRKESIDIFKAMKKENIDYQAFCFSLKITDKYYLNVQKEVTESIINKQVLDNLIEIFIKSEKDYIASQLIKINILLRGEKLMKDRLKGAFICAKKVAESLEKNKLESYRQKLTSSIIFKDYDRVCQILLQLSNYSGIEFGFVYDLFDDFEENKDLAYTFINALSKKSEINN